MTGDMTGNVKGNVTELQKAAAAAADNGDWLGYGAYADALWSRIQDALKADAKPGDLASDPLVVGVFGEWGAGKSKLLELIYQRAMLRNAQDSKAREQNPTPGTGLSKSKPFTLTVPVWFHPWKYEHEAHLGVPLLMHVQAALAEALGRASTPVEQLFADYKKANKWFGETTITAHEQAEKWSKLLANEFLQLGVGVAVGTLFTPAAGVAATAGIKWLEKTSTAVGEATAGMAKQNKNAKAAAVQSDVPLVSQDGSYYYKTHQHLRKLTRLKPLEQGKTSDIKNLDAVRSPVNINFVVFVDDLDRCLPEKAVQVLELIKTLFSVESFAFVLALDDEVIERGIGHRYKEYKLQDKKPEMPITGFEYLEKIVHLPFRLPALTRDLARLMIKKYEHEVEPDHALKWFDRPTPLRVGERLRNPEIGAKGGTDTAQEEADAGNPFNLMDLALAGFDAYVPRKLIRLVELVHQVSRIASERQRPLQVEGGGDVDVRVVLVLLMIQLFQPELSRILRRRPESFPMLLAAFSPRPNLGSSTEQPAADLADARLSDIDLWRWALAPRLKEAEPWNPPSQEQIYTYAVNRIAELHRSNSADRLNAEQIRLPIVRQQIEHRAAQRHVLRAQTGAIPGNKYGKQQLGPA